LSLRTVIFGGEALEFSGLKRWLERHGDESPQLINMYGITETTVHTTFKRVMNEDLKESTGSVIGKSLANMRMYLLDEHLQPVPVGVVGELYVAGTGMSRGYLEREDLTAERFIPTHYGKPGERVYKTGDLAKYLSDGNIEYLGRKDHQVKIRGYRIELGEIESALLQHEAIKEAVVIATGEAWEDKKLVAYLVGSSSEQLVISDLKIYLKQKLPDYMAPAGFVVMEKMPLTLNGKLDARALPELRKGDGGLAYAIARTPVEEIVVGVFEEVLKLDRVGIYDNFFEIGGHSLLATQAISRIRALFGIEIGVRSIFEETTAASLARRIEDAMSGVERRDVLPLVRAEGKGRLPLSFAQQRLWFLDQLAPNNSLYNISSAIRMEGRLDLEALEKVVNEIIRRHEVLRTRFEVEEEKPVQVIDKWEPHPLELNDLTSLPSEEQEERVVRVAREESEAGFDLGRGPLLRVKVLKLGDEAHVALFTVHHIVSDGWSINILIREVGALYQAYSTGAPSPLEELPIQYADFAVWQRKWLQGEALENQLAYWMRQLGGDLPTLELRTDRPRPAKQTGHGAQRSHLLPRALSNSLKALSLGQGCTLFMTLLAAFKTLLYYMTGQTDICVGTDIANRSHAETENLIGFFVNQLVLRTEFSGNPTFEELLKRVREVTLGAYAHQDLPFEKLVEALNPDREVSRPPLFQVKMALQNAPAESFILPGITLKPVGVMSDTAKFDLLLNLTDTENGLFISLEYSTDLFDESASARITNRFNALLDRIVERRDARLQELVEFLIDEDKREELEKDRELENVLLSKFKSAKRRTISGTSVEAEK
jgi:hypothetical protein